MSQNKHMLLIFYGAWAVRRHLQYASWPQAVFTEDHVCALVWGYTSAVSSYCQYAQQSLMPGPVGKATFYPIKKEPTIDMVVKELVEEIQVQHSSHALRILQTIGCHSSLARITRKWKPVQHPRYLTKRLCTDQFLAPTELEGRRDNRSIFEQLVHLCLEQHNCSVRTKPVFDSLDDLTHTE